MTRVLFYPLGFLALLCLGIYPGRAQASAPPPPSDFDATAAAPPNLPSRIDIPPNTRIEVTAWHKNPTTSDVPVDPNNPRLLWDPDLKSAVIESNDQDVHAVFQWEGGRQSDAFIIGGLCFRLVTFAHPNSISITGNVLDFWVNRQNPNEGGNGNFPVISAYSPANFAGTASVDGKSVLVFAPGGQSSKVKTYPEGNTVCLDAKTLLPVRIEDGPVIYTFSYSPDAHVQINPQGPFLQAIQGKFGHWP